MYSNLNARATSSCKARASNDIIQLSGDDSSRREHPYGTAIGTNQQGRAWQYDFKLRVNILPYCTVTVTTSCRPQPRDYTGASRALGRDQGGAGTEPNEASNRGPRTPRHCLYEGRSFHSTMGRPLLAHTARVEAASKSPSGSPALTEKFSAG